MSRFKDFNDLVLDTKQKIRNFGITSKTVFKCYDSCVKQLEKVMAQGNLLFSKELALQWLEENYSKPNQKNNRYSYRCAYRRPILLLSDNFNGCLNEWKFYKSIHAKQPSTHNYLLVLDSYLKYLTSCNYAENTIQFKMRCARYFLIFLEEKKIFELYSLNHMELASYFSCEHFKNRKPSGVKAEFLEVKHFIIFLEDHNYVELKNLHFVPPASHVKERRIVTTISKEIELKQI